MENVGSRVENPLSKPYHLSSVNHALDMFEVLAASDRPMTVTELAKATSLVKSGAFRILQNLERRGYVRKDTESRYSLGTGIWQLSRSLTQLSALREQARPLLVALTRATGETAHLALLDRLYSVYVDKTETPASIRAYAEIGDRAPAYAVATGKVLLSCLAPDELEVLLGAPLEGFTATTITDPAGLAKELAGIRRQGYAINDGEWREEVVGVAVPARLPNGVVVALGLAGPRYRFEVPTACAHLPLLLEQAHRLENHLGLP